MKITQRHAHNTHKIECCVSIISPEKESENKKI